MPAAVAAAAVPVVAVVPTLVAGRRVGDPPIGVLVARAVAKASSRLRQGRG